MKKVLILIIVLSQIVLTGCNDFLDTVPDNRTEVNTVDKISALMVTAYPSIPFASFLDARCDGYVDRGVTVDGTQPTSTFDHIGAAFTWSEFPASLTNESPEQYWSACYAAIAVCNHALKAIGELPNPTTANKQKGEALVARAYSHFCLLSIFSDMFDRDKMNINPGIPYADKTEGVVIQQYERGTVAYTLQRISDDLATGIELIGGEGDYKEPSFHFTTRTAMAFAARVALFTGDNASAIVYANSVIPSPSTFSNLRSNGVLLTNKDGSLVDVVALTDPAQMTLRSTFHDWAAYSEFGNSDMMSKTFSGASSKSNLLVIECQSQLNYSQRGAILSRYAIDKSNFNKIFGDNVANGVLTTGRSTYSYDSGETPFVPKFFRDFKYSDIVNGIGYSYVKVPQIRMEEILLIRAEAYALTGQYTKAIHDLQLYAACRISDYSLGKNYISKDELIAFYGLTLNKENVFIRNEYNAYRFSETPGTYNDLLQKSIVLSVLDFRRSEFIWEGMRYFDILRWSIPVTHTTVDGRSSTLEPRDSRRVVQLPPTTKLSGLEPNEYIPQGWK